MSDEFKTRLIAYAKAAISRSDRVASEEATRQYLVLPFFQFLGYDPLNPDEIVPEAHASFSDKFKNRVDYAILKATTPVIAVECKKTGELKLANRGELKGYFNAVPTVKLGILTDGLTYEMFTDTGLENMMDDEPFARLDLREIAEEKIDMGALDALVQITRDQYDPANIGAEAKRRLFFAKYIDALDGIMRGPAMELVRLLMDKAEVDGMRTNRLLQEHLPIVQEAIQAYMDRKILERVGFAQREDLVRTAPVPAADTDAGAAASAAAELVSHVITTDAELSLYDYVCKRLSFLVKDEALFAKIGNVRWVDHKTVFVIYYRQERKGRLMNFVEGNADMRYRLTFGDDGATIETNDLATLDEPLLRVFTRRVEELG